MLILHFIFLGLYFHCTATKVAWTLSKCAVGDRVCVELIIRFENQKKSYWLIDLRLHCGDYLDRLEESMRVDFKHELL